MEDKNNLDDLIGTSGQPIVVQDSGSDKRFLYIIIALLIVLFIIALGVIAFIGGKYFGSNNTNTSSNATTPQVQSTTTIQKALEQKEAEQQQVKQKESKPEPKQQQVVAKVAEPKANTTTTNDIDELEKIVQEQEQEKPKEPEPEPKPKAQTKEQKVIAQAATAATGGKALSQEELAKIAQLVAQELAKSRVVNTTTTSNKQEASQATNKDEELVASLQSAQTDTLKSEQINTQTLKDTKVNNSGAAKKVDTFNKVIVKEQTGGDDEIAKLSAEIDSILQSEEVTKHEKSLKYGKELNQEIKSREREMRFIVVKPGDTLSSLALKAYGRSSAYIKIYKANPDLIKNPNKIYVGMRIRVPVDEEDLKQQGK